MRDPLITSNGEQAERRRAFQKKVIFGSLFAAGLLSGMYVGAHLARSDLDLAAPWPPVAAATIAAVYVLAILLGSVLLAKRTDEVERMNQYKATAVAGGAYMLIYPTWFALWKGGFVAEPVHWVVFVIFWLVLAGASLFYRFR